MKLADYYIEDEDFDKAIATYKKILRKENLKHDLSPSLKTVISPQLDTSYAKIVKPHFQNAKDYFSVNKIDRAQDEYQRVIDSIKDYECLSGIYLLPDYQAKKWKRKLVEAYFDLGKITFLKEQLDNSLLFSKRVAEINPDYKDIYSIFFSSPNEHRRFGLLLLNTGLNEAAIQHFQIFAKQKPKNVLIHYYLALLLKESGKWSDAVEEFKKVVSLSKGPKIAKANRQNVSYLANSLYHVGLDFEKEGNIDKSIEYYKSALKIDNQIIDCYYRLMKIYEKVGRTEEANAVKLKLLHLDPKYKLKYEFDDYLTLLGYSLDELELEMKPRFQITFFWRLKDDEKFKDFKLEGFDQIVDDLNSKLYQANDRIYDVREIVNQAPNPGFELDPPGRKFPVGWNFDIYYAPKESHEILTDSQSSSGENQCLLLDNSSIRSTSCQSSLISVDPKHKYLQAGWIKGLDAYACLGRIWGSGVYNYVTAAVSSPKWKCYSQVIVPPPKTDRCSLWLLNFESNGKAYFDKILFIEVSEPLIGKLGKDIGWNVKEER